MFGPALLALHGRGGPLPRNRDGERRDARDLPHEGPLASAAQRWVKIMIYDLKDLDESNDLDI